MKIHHLRNATFVLESKEHHILIDPMLGEKGSLPPFTYLRHEARKNPIVPLPDNADRVLDRVTHCLVTHSQKWGIKALTHTDHFDPPGQLFLKKNKIPVVCAQNDTLFMEKQGLKVTVPLTAWQPRTFLEGTITAVPAVHGHTWTRVFLANGIGFFLELPDEPSIYISGDTVFTRDVQQVLAQLKPDIAVVAAGSAQLDLGGPILMPLQEIFTFIEKTPGTVVANHMEALNHCPVTREGLRQALKEKDLLNKTLIPTDGETLIF